MLSSGRQPDSSEYGHQAALLLVPDLHPAGQVQAGEIGLVQHEELLLSDAKKT